MLVYPFMCVEYDRFWIFETVLLLNKTFYKKNTCLRAGEFENNTFTFRNSQKPFVKRCTSVNIYSYQPQLITETRRKIEDLCRLEKNIISTLYLTILVISLIWILDHWKFSSSNNGVLSLRGTYNLYLI